MNARCSALNGLLPPVKARHDPPDHPGDEPIGAEPCLDEVEVYRAGSHLTEDGVGSGDAVGRLAGPPPLPPPSQGGEKTWGSGCVMLV